MDDCNLEKLGINPGKIAPAFKQDVLEYSATVQSNVAEVTLTTLTRDSGASYTISVGVFCLQNVGELYGYPTCTCMNCDNVHVNKFLKMS